MELVAQAHGGAIKTGGNPGNKGGTGRTPSLIRDALRGSFDERIQFLNDVADGKAMQKIRVRVIDICDLLVCANCGEPGQLAPNSLEAAIVEVDAIASATVKDRLGAVEMLGKYGLGTLKEVSSETVRDKMKETLRLIQERTSVEQFQGIVEVVRPLWAA